MIDFLTRPGQPESCFGVVRQVLMSGEKAGWQVTVDVPDLSGLIVQRALWSSAFIASVEARQVSAGRSVKVCFVVGASGTRQPVVEYLVGD